MRKCREIKIIANFTEGWEDRLAKASYNLYLGLEAKGVKDNFTGGKEDKDFLPKKRHSA